MACNVPADAGEHFSMEWDEDDVVVLCVADQVEEIALELMGF